MEASNLALELSKKPEICFREISLKIGSNNSFISVDNIDTEEYFSERDIILSGSLSGQILEGLVIEITQFYQFNRHLQLHVDYPSKGKFIAKCKLKNGQNLILIKVIHQKNTILEKKITLNYKSSFKEWNETIIIAFVLAVIIRSLVIQAFWIPTGSMEPTLFGEKYDPATNKQIRSGDRILVSRFAYVADLSLDGRFPFLPRLWFKMPKRGDIVVFKFPNPDPTAPPKDFIKRVIGLPGDEVKIQDGIVYVNGNPLYEPYISEPPYFDIATTVPDNAIFVMGDNRNNSYDSRYWGPMPLSNLKGQAVLVYSPIKRFSPIRSYKHQIGISTHKNE